MRSEIRQSMGSFLSNRAPRGGPVNALLAMAARALLAMAARALLAMAAGLLMATSAAAQDGGSYIGSYSDWEGHVYRIDAAESRCAVRAIHPAILEAEINWVYNTRYFDRLPDGFLAIDRRVADGARALEILIDGSDRFSLRIGDDGHGYSRDADAGRLLAAMRRGIAMTVTIRRRTTEPQVFAVSLLGFTRGSTAARSACDRAAGVR